MLRGNVPVKEMAKNRPTASERIMTRLFGGIMVQTYPYQPLFLQDSSEKILDAVNLPVIYVGGVVSEKGISQLMKKGFSFVQIGRATIRDSEFPNKLIKGEITESDCDICNRCIAAMDGGGVRCVSAEEDSIKRH